MKLSRVLLALAALFVAPTCFAGSLTSTWSLVTTYEDGTPLTAQVTYRMQWGPEGQALSKSMFVSKPPAIAADIAPGRWCVQIVSIVENVEGLPTSPSCVTVSPPPPPPKKKPAAVTAVQVTAAP
jgi:hypothetical protein